MTHFWRLFSWWHGSTIGTSFTIWKRGVFVGEDEFGNRYYRSKRVDPTLGKERRWVIYSNRAEPTLVPPGWHGWIHHRVDVPPTLESYAPREWQRPHLPNLTGTPEAYRPPGSILNPDPDRAVSEGYDAWTPGN